MKKCIVTVLGKDTVGIIAKVCTYLAEIILISLIYHRQLYLNFLI